MISASHVLLTLFFCANVWRSFAAPLWSVLEQAPLMDSNGIHVRAALKKAEIIPDVLNDFTPSISLSLVYPSKHVSVQLGNILPPSSVSSAPILEIHALSSSIHPTHTIRSNTTYTIALTDPDATSRSDPVKAEMCHWIATGISLAPVNAKEIGEAVGLPSSSSLFIELGPQVSTNITEIMPYFAPSPPPKTGLHRYVFVLLAPSPGEDHRDIDLKKPDDRPHWGYRKIGKGVKKWAKENKLVVVGKQQLKLFDPRIPRKQTLGSALLSQFKDLEILENS